MTICRIEYKQKKPKKAHIAILQRAGIAEHCIAPVVDGFTWISSNRFSISDAFSFGEFIPTIGSPMIFSQIRSCP
jgi:hypothetical protein